MLIRNLHNLSRCIITSLDLFIIPKLSDLFLSITFNLRLVVFVEPSDLCACLYRWLFCVLSLK